MLGTVDEIKRLRDNVSKVHGGESHSNTVLGHSKHLADDAPNTNYTSIS